MESVSIVGLGRLGAPFAAVAASSGIVTIGVDTSADRVDAINAGRAPVDETGLEELIGRCRPRLRATTDVAAAVRDTSATFVIVPTPSEEGGKFRLDAVLSACAEIGRALRGKSAYHLVVISSTVLPGSMSGPIVQCLEAASGKQCGGGFGLCYSPEFVALGSVIHDLRHPDMLLIGESDAVAGSLLESIYQKICENRPAVRRMNFINAEITKISVNTFVTTKISYANMLAELCESLPGADAAVVTAALGEDSRIGAKYLKSALGYGGPCFPRDNAAFVACSRSLGLQATLAEATDEVNRRQAPRLAQLVGRHVAEGSRVAVLGLSYKPGTSVVDESQGVALARALAASGATVTVYDPAAAGNARLEMGAPVDYAATLEECIREADVIVLATPWPEFSALSPAHFAGRQRRPVLIDCWRMWEGRGLEEVADLIRLGAGPLAGSQMREMAQAL